MSSPAATRPVPLAAIILSCCALVAAAAASVVTLLWDGAFPAPVGASSALAEARGWSAVTLAMAVLPGAFALAAARRGSLRGRLVWTGVMTYLVYSYLELALAPPFSALYLVYIATFGCAIPAALMAAATIDLGALPGAFSARTPRRTAIVYALAFPVVLALAWLRGIVARTSAGAFGWPSGDAAIGHVVQALDLGLQVPLGLCAGLLLWRRRPVGYLVMAVCLVMAACMSAALVGMVGMAALGAGKSVLAAAPFALFAVLSLLLALAYLRGATPAAHDAARSSSSERSRALRVSSAARSSATRASS